MESWRLRVPSVAIGALATAIGALIMIVGCAEETRPLDDDLAAPPSERPTLTYYYIPECFLCEEVRPMLADLHAEYGNRIHFRELDYHLFSSQEDLRNYAFGHHGLVITDPEGAVLWSDAEHQKREIIEAAIRKVLKSQGKNRRLQDA